jgi:hypothetical protein
MSNSPQKEGTELDVNGQSAEKTRARGGGVGQQAEGLAQAIENAPHVHQAKNLKEIIDSFSAIRVMLIAEAVRGMGAVTYLWSASKKAYEEKVDYPTRQRSIAWLAGYSDGLPAQTTFNYNANASATPAADPFEKLATSPAARAALRRALDQADKEAIEKAKPAQSQ